MKLTLQPIIRSYGIAIAFIIICAVMTALSPVFLTVTNVLNVIRQSSIFGIMAIGMTFVILTGGIDLSVGSILAVVGAISAGMLKGGMEVLPVVILALAIGISCGLANGVLITVGRIAPFVVTLGMMSADLYNWVPYQRVCRRLPIYWWWGYLGDTFSHRRVSANGRHCVGHPDSDSYGTVHLRDRRQ